MKIIFFKYLAHFYGNFGFVKCYNQQSVCKRSARQILPIKSLYFFDLYSFCVDRKINFLSLLIRPVD